MSDRIDALLPVARGGSREQRFLMNARDRMTQFPPNVKSNPGQTAIQGEKEKQKLTRKVRVKAPRIRRKNTKRSP